MTHRDRSKIKLSRRKILAGLGTVGVASASAGVGTTTFLSDREDLPNNTVTAGSEHLKVDWQEHYADMLGDEAEIDGVRTVESPEEVDENEVGLPYPGSPAVAVDDTSLTEFMNATALEAFPDPDDDGIQGGEGFEYDPCIHGADTPEDLDPTPEGALRTHNTDTVEDGEPKPVVAVEDVKPGDFGELTLSFHVCEDDSYVWMTGELVDESENGMTEPERNDPDESGYTDSEDENPGELADAVQTAVWYNTDCDNIQDVGEDELIFEGSLSQTLSLLSQADGIPLDGDLSTSYDEVVETDGEFSPNEGDDPNRDCFASDETNCVALAWWIPEDYGDEIQTDSVRFDVGFYSEQCSANDGS
ncbi:MAG: hypothetical protein SV253_02755 [Halobacteria archaeon]|nr:hypothetical protein [Halobacteria archaeon]